MQARQCSVTMWAQALCGQNLPAHALMAVLLAGSPAMTRYSQGITELKMGLLGPR